MRSNTYSILQWDFVDWSILKQHAQTQGWPPNWNIVQIQSEPFEPSSQMSPKKNFWATLSSNSKSRKKLIPCMKLPTLDSQQKCATKTGSAKDSDKGLWYHGIMLSYKQKFWASRLLARRLSIKAAYRTFNVSVCPCWESMSTSEVLPPIPMQSCKLFATASVLKTF